jgi:phosphoserine phosphatase RsbU/P
MGQAMARTEHELDLALAAELQAALLPLKCPLDCAHQRAAARNRMCGSIGGDFHDFIAINEDQAAIVIGDVVGHGVRASLIMAQIAGFLRSSDSRRSRPAELVAALNRMLIDLGERAGTITSCSLIYGVIDAPTGLAILINAGHPHPFLCDIPAGTVDLLASHNLLLGVEEFQPEEICLAFEPGHRLVLYSDGLTDAVDSEGRQFSKDILEGVVRQHLRSAPRECADAVFDAVAAHRAGQKQADDETIVVIDRI